jgi:hypothetical protein
MIVIGFVILALAVAAAITAIAQNQSAMVDVHGLGYTWNVHLLWVFVAGLVVAAVGFIGISMMRAGAAHAARLRVERRGLVRENARLSDVAANPPVQPVAAQPTTAAPVVAQPTTAGPVDGSYAADGSTVYEPAPRQHALWHRTRHV